MSTILRYPFVIAAIALPALAATGCRVEAETLDRFNGTPQERDVDWVSGQPITIRNQNGDIRVKVEGSAVHVYAVPFTRAADEAEAKSDIESRLSLNTTTDANGNILIDGIKTGDVYTGWDLVVSIPSAFDAALTVDNNNGGTDVEGVGNAASAAIIQNNGSVEAYLGNAAINVTSDNGSIELSVAGGGSGSVATGNGSITFGITSSANAQITAAALDGGGVFVDGDVLPAGWQESVASESAKSYTLNSGGGTYDLQASGTSLADVVIVPQ